MPIEDKMDLLLKQMQLMAQGAGQAGGAMANMSEDLQSVKDATKDLAAAYDKLHKAQKTQVKDTSDIEKEIEGLRGDYVKALQVQARFKQSMSEANKEVRLLMESYKRFGERLKDTGEAMGRIAGVGIGLGASFGAQAIGLRKVIDSVKSYNENLFKIDRTQQVFGRGVGNLNEAFRVVAKQTTLSKVQFLQFSQTMMEGYKGIRPSINAMAEFASVLSKQFNPTAEEAIRVGKQFLDVYSKFPAAGEAIKEAMELASKGPLTGAEQKKLQGYKSMIVSLKLQGKISEEQANTFMQGTTKTTKKQQSQIDLNRKITKSAASVEDAMLEVGKQSEGALKLAATATTLLYTGLQNVAGAAAMATAAMAAMNAQVSIKSAMQTIGYASGGGGAGGVAAAAAGSALLPGAQRTNQMQQNMGKKPGLFSGMFGRSGGASAGSGGGGKGVSGGGGKFAGFGGGAAPIILISGVMSGASAYSENKDKGAGVAAGAAAARGGGAMAGAGLGAVLGTAVGPAGTMIGGMLGGMIGDKIGRMLEEKIAPKTEEIKDANEEINDELFKQNAAYEKEVANNRYILETSEQIAESTKKRLDMMIQLGVSLKEQGGLLKQQLSDYASQVNAANQVLGNVQRIVSTISKESGVEWMPDASLSNLQNAEKAIQAMSAAASKINVKAAGTKDETERSKLLAEEVILRGDIKVIQDAINASYAAEKGYVDASVASGNAAAKQQEEMNSVYTERLATQRQLMETSQFGFGASVAMLQEQVDLEFKLMKAQQDRIKENRKAAMAAGGLTEQQAMQLESAKDYNEAWNMITKSFGKTGKEAKALVGISQDMQKSQSETMKHQQKIYELTKEMREGYLDAMTEMSTNLGEFTAIVGTLETGFTQMMDVVKDVEGSEVLNTMRGGVRVGRDSASYGARQQAAGVMTPQGPVFRGKQKEELLNQDVFGYGETRTAFDAMQRGETSESPVAGTAVSDAAKYATESLLDENSTLRPEIMKGSVGDGVLDGLRKFMNGGGSLYINPAVSSGVPLGGELGFDPNKGQNIVGTAARVTRTPQGRSALAPAGNVPSNAGFMQLPDAVKKVFEQNGQRAIEGGDGSDKLVTEYKKSTDRLVKTEVRVSEKQMKAYASYFGRNPKMLQKLFGENADAARQISSFVKQQKKDREAKVTESKEWRKHIKPRWTETREQAMGGGDGIARIGSTPRGVVGIGRTPKGVRGMTGVAPGALRRYKQTGRLSSLYATPSSVVKPSAKSEPAFSFRASPSGPSKEDLERSAEEKARLAAAAKKEDERKALESESKEMAKKIVEAQNPSLPVQHGAGTRSMMSQYVNSPEQIIEGGIGSGGPRINAPVMPGELKNRMKQDRLKASDAEDHRRIMNREKSIKKAQTIQDEISMSKSRAGQYGENVIRKKYEAELFEAEHGKEIDEYGKMKKLAMGKQVALDSGEMATEYSPESMEAMVKRDEQKEKMESMIAKRKDLSYYLDPSDVEKQISDYEKEAKREDSVLAPKSAKKVKAEAQAAKSAQSAKPSTDLNAAQKQELMSGDRSVASGDQLIDSAIGAGGGGAGGEIKVVVFLAAGLDAKIENATSVVAEIQRATG